MILNEFETIIDLLKKDMKIIQRTDHFAFSLDSLLISEFASITKNVNNIVDLGTGNAAIPLFLSKRTKAKIIGIEIQEISSDLAVRNVQLNNLENQISIINDNMINWKKYFIPHTLDMVVSNPPFFKFDGNEEQLNNLTQLTLARHEISITLEGIIETAAGLLKDKGYFVLVHRVDRLIEIIELMKKHNIEPKRIQFCHSKIDKEGKILLVEGIKYGKSGLRILPPLFTHNENGQYSDEVLEMFK